jgi:hypothetical protein
VCNNGPRYFFLRFGAAENARRLSDGLTAAQQIVAKFASGTYDNRLAAGNWGTQIWRHDKGYYNNLVLEGMEPEGTDISDLHDTWKPTPEGAHDSKHQQIDRNSFVC